MCTLGLGLAALGRPEYLNIRSAVSIDKSEAAFKENAFLVLDKAYACGVRFFDTAPSYGKGEAFLQEWNASRKHADVVLSSKWGYTYVANWKLGFLGPHEVKEHSLQKLKEQWQVTQGLLPKLKVYQIHSATFESAVLQNTAVLQHLFQLKKEFGLQLGLTVSGPKQKELLTEASEICLDNEPLFDSFQVTYNLFEQAAFEVLKQLKGAGRFLIVKEGLANGRIFLPTKTRNTLEGLALKYQVGIDAIALRFCMDAVGPNVVLSGAASAAQLTQNLCALNFQLTPSEIEQLKGAKMPTETYWHERSQLPWG